MMHRRWLPAATILAVVVWAPARAQDTLPAPSYLPPQVTDSAVSRGRELFHGTASCSACHGAAGVGSDSGPALVEGVWLHGPDSYEGILARVVHGIPKAYSTRNQAMPMRGWNTMSDSEARDVAAYVWLISHGWLRPKRPGS